MSSLLNNDDPIAKDINNEKLDNSLQRSNLYTLPKEREQSWWQARQQLIERKEKKMFWYGENSLIMWLLWQLVVYVVVAMALMLLNNIFGISLPLWQYVSLFVIQTIFFVSERTHFWVYKLSLRTRPKALYLFCTWEEYTNM